MRLKKRNSGELFMLEVDGAGIAGGIGRYPLHVGDVLDHIELSFAKYYRITIASIICRAQEKHRKLRNEDDYEFIQPKHLKLIIVSAADKTGNASQILYGDQTSWLQAPPYSRLFGPDYEKAMREIEKLAEPPRKIDQPNSDLVLSQLGALVS